MRLVQLANTINTIGSTTSTTRFHDKHYEVPVMLARPLPDEKKSASFYKTTAYHRASPKVSDSKEDLLSMG